MSAKPTPTIELSALNIEEATMSSTSVTPLDPLQLRTKLIGEEGVQAVRNRKSPAGLFGKFKARGKREKVAEFYEGQDEHIENLLKSIDQHAAQAADDVADNALKVKIAIHASFVANCILAILQLYGAASSASLSLIATCADSVFDPFSNLILNKLHSKGKTADPTKWPQGGAKFETIGNIVYGAFMWAVNLVIIVESIRGLASHDPSEDDGKLHIPSLIAVGIAFATKFALFLYCYTIRSSSSQVQVLWEDHRNDLFINGLGITTSALGSKVVWWLDPGGAIFIAALVAGLWTRTIRSQFLLLAGMSAGPEYQQLVIYKAMTFSPLITAIDSCRVYHSGPEYVVELDIVMPPETPLWQAHDVSQDLQDALERLPEVDRAFVHVDHNVSHAIEHRKER